MGFRDYWLTILSRISIPDSDPRDFGIFGNFWASPKKIPIPNARDRDLGSRKNPIPKPTLIYKISRPPFHWVIFLFRLMSGDFLHQKSHKTFFNFVTYGVWTVSSTRKNISISYKFYNPHALESGKNDTFGKAGLHHTVTLANVFNSAEKHKNICFTFKKFLHKNDRDAKKGASGVLEINKDFTL